MGGLSKLLPNGKILCAGGTQIPNSGYDSDLLLTQFNTDGSIDTDFGDNGISATDYNNKFEDVLAMCLVGDKIQVSINMEGGNDKAAGFKRFNADGSLDTTFGDGGFAFHSIEGMHLMIINMLTLPNGKILAVGDAVDNNSNLLRHWYVGRYNADMTLDTTFANGLGYWIEPVAGGNNNVRKVAVNTDGKIIVAGRKQVVVWDGFVVMQFNEDGTVDETFGVEGTTMFHFADFVDYLYGLQLQPDGKILLSGGVTYTQTPFGGADFCMARLNTSGSLDTSFGVGGKIIYDMNLTQSETSNDILLRGNGKMVIGGLMSVNGQYDTGLLFLNQDGSPDTLFGPDGRVTTDFNDGETNVYESIYNLNEQPDGKIVASGNTVINNIPASTLARYNVEQPTASVQQQGLDKSVNVYPNPVSNVLYIKFNLPQEQDAQIKLFSVNGQEIATDYSGAKVSVNNNTIALNNFAALSKGMYLVQVTAGNTTQTFKVVK